MVLTALCANELQREDECGMIWTNEIFMERRTELSATCPDEESDECRLPESCLQL
jgi:hypothetical protein